MPEQVPLTVKVTRMNELVQLTNDIGIIRNQKECGLAFEVMVEGPSERDPQKYAGRARNNKAFVFPMADKPGLTPGEIVSVLAEEAHLWGFSGRYCK